MKTMKQMNEIEYNGTWRSYRSLKGEGFDGPEINGSVLAYSAQTHPNPSKRVPVNLKKLTRESALVGKAAKR